MPDLPFYDAAIFAAVLRKIWRRILHLRIGSLRPRLLRMGSDSAEAAQAIPAPVDLRHVFSMKPYYHDERAGITIHHGDCREILPTLGKFCACISDPPYGVNHSSSHGASWANSNIQGDHSSELRDWAWNYFSECPRAMFGQSWKIAAPLGVRGCLAWDKGAAFGMGDLSFPWKPSWEEIYIAGNGWEGRRDEGVLRGPVVVSWETKGRVHPHQKPVWIFSHLIAKLPNARRYIDPFLGSGPMLEAAKLAGVSAVGIDIEERYCEIAARRLQQEVLAL